MIWWLISTGHELKADFFLHHNERRGSSQHSLFSTLKIISTGGPISFFFELVALWLVGESFWVIRLLELSVFYLKFISGPMIFKVDKRLCWEELRRSLWDAKIILLSDRALCWSIVKLSPIDEWMSPVNYSRKLTFAYYILDITSSIDFSLKNSCDVVLCWWQPWNNWSQELPEPRYSKLIVQIDDQNRK